ncbi:MAG: hypothetical protein ACJ77Z_10940 [Thermoleophilaceae bacterium]
MKLAAGAAVAQSALALLNQFEAELLAIEVSGAIMVPRAGIFAIAWLLASDPER